MKLHEVVKKAYEKQWSFTNSFSIQIDPASQNMRALEFYTLGEELNMHVAKANIPNTTHEAKETYTVGGYRLVMGPDQVYRFEIEFADHDNMSLWRSFMEQYRLTKLGYYDDIKMDVSFYKESDYNNSEDSQLLIRYVGSTIENVSGIQFSNEDDAQIAKFTVSFRSPEFSLN